MASHTPTKSRRTHKPRHVATPARQGDYRQPTQREVAELLARINRDLDALEDQTDRLFRKLD